MEGAETIVTLAHGTKKGIVKDGNVTIEEDRETFDPEFPKLVSLGRLKNFEFGVAVDAELC